MKYEKEQQCDETILWNNFCSGDLKAFTCIYSTYLRPLYSYGRKFSKDTAFIEDCIQDLFVELWKNRKQLGATNSAKYYLYKSLRRKIFRQMAEANKHMPEALMENYTFEMELSIETDLVSNQLMLEQKQLLEKSLQNLTKRQREAIYLRFYENLSYEEVASIMSLELRSVYNLISKSIDTLKHTTPQAFFLLLLFLSYN
jgi:RNA polymerase sigma factor (sigma-70 family)